MLEVKASGAKSWIARLQYNGHRRDFGLGSVKDVTLEQARDLAREYRRLVRLGLDPVAERRKPSSSTPTFETAAREVYAERKGHWQNPKHRAQWLSTLETYVFPFIGPMSVDAVGTEHVRDLLARIWLTKPETARRVRQRVGTVLDYAQAKGWRDAAFSMQTVNRGLPKQPRKGGGYKAMPYADLPDFFSKLRDRVTVSRIALEALVLTAARSGEIRKAVWSEVDLDAAKWTIPAARMKGGVTHNIPLSPAAVNTFRQAKAFQSPVSDFVFPGAKPKRPLSDMTLLKFVRSAGSDATVHGFRSTFRDWCAERTRVPREVVEVALAHANPNRVEASYLRTDFFERRVPLMADWALFCTGEKADPLDAQGQSSEA